MVIVHSDLNDDYYELSKKMVVVTSIASSSRRSIYQQSNKVKANLVIQQSSAPPVSQSRSPETTCLSHESLPFGCSWILRKTETSKHRKHKSCFKSWAPVAAQAPLAQRTPILVVGSRTFLSMWCPKNQKVDIINSSQILSTCPAFFEQLSPWIFHFQAGNLMQLFFRFQVGVCLESSIIKGKNFM